MPLEIHKSHRARDDLLRIWLYTAERWGVEQADHYLDQLDAGIARLIEMPLAGADFGNVRRDIAGWPSNGTASSTSS